MDNTYRLFAILSTADVNMETGIVTIKFHETMKPHLLLCLKEKYTQNTLMYVLPMRSRYSIRLYELFKSWSWLGFAKEFSFAELKEQLNIEKKYARGNDLKKE